MRVGTRPITLLALALSCALGLSAACPSSAAARDCQPANHLSTCIDSDNLWIRPGQGPFIAIGPGTTTPAGKIELGIAATYLARPIGLRVGSTDPEGTIVGVVDGVVDATFLWAIGITDRLELSVATPVTLYQAGAGLGEIVGTDEELPRSAIRDLRLGAGFAILPRSLTGPPRGIGLTARFDFTLPTGDAAAFAGSRTVVAAPSLVVEPRFGRVTLIAEAGARIRGETRYAGARIGPQILGGAGVAVDVIDRRRLTLGLEAFGLFTLAKQEPPARERAEGAEEGPYLVPAEWLFSVSSAPLLAGDVRFTLGAGTSIPLATEGAVTSPAFRAHAGVHYAPTGRDEDADGVLDRDDRCPGKREDRDGFQDDDGCADPDNDGDRIPDERDRCRDAAETIDGFKDDDGCPDPDDDDDGIPDESDRCRNEAEDRDGFEDGDGCPDPDNDGDGVLDEADRCPTGAEDRDGFKDEDGCPDPDNDLDRIPDGADRCPGAAEDRDGFEDADGCPEPDDDEDGVLDGADPCAREPETIDGTADDDGCPEKGARSLVAWDGDRVVVEQPVRFPKGKATVTEPLEAQLRQIAQLVRGRAPLESVLVEGYPDRRGDESPRAVELAAKRAEAVRDVLARHGIPADRIHAAAGEPGAKRGPKAPVVDVTVARARGGAERKKSGGETGNRR